SRGAGSRAPGARGGTGCTTAAPAPAARESPASSPPGPSVPCGSRGSAHRSPDRPSRGTGCSSSGLRGRRAPSPAARARGGRPGRRRRRAAAWRSPSARSKNPPVAEIEGDGDVRADGEDEEHRQRGVEEPPPAHDPLEAVVERDLHPHLLEPEVAAPELDEVAVVLEMEARAKHAD